MFGTNMEHTDSLIVGVFGPKQLCTAAQMWQTFTWPKAAPNLFTT